MMYKESHHERAEYSCADCSFCQERTGFFVTHDVCACPDKEERDKTILRSDSICEHFVAAPRTQFGIPGLTREGGKKDDNQHLRIGCDVHTHTLFSRHAYSTIQENVEAAARAGIELLGSTDHFSSMLFAEQHTKRAQGYDLRDFQYFLNYSVWPKTWQGVHLLHGAEIDIVDLQGRLFGHDIGVSFEINGMPKKVDTSLKEEVFRAADYAIASVHNRSIAEGTSLAQTTAMYVHALEDPKVLILGHTGRSGVPFDTDEVLCAARDLGKLIELNETTLARHERAAACCKKLAERCAELGVMISTGSDAHISCDVGQLGHVRAMLEEIHFPQELIATRDAQTYIGCVRALHA